MTMNKSISMIHHPEVIRPIQTTLRSFGVRKQDLEDGVAEVQTRTLEYLRGKAIPTEIEQWVALCVTITRSWRLDEKKKAKTAKKYCEGLCEDPDQRIGIEAEAGERDLVDARRMLRELQGQFDAGEMPEKGEQILDCVQAGMKQTEIAVELGITAEAVRMRMRKMRELFEARLTRLGITGVLFVLVMLASGSAMAANQARPTAPPTQVPVPPPRIRGVAWQRYRDVSRGPQDDEAGHRDAAPAGRSVARLRAVRARSGRSRSCSEANDARFQMDASPLQIVEALFQIDEALTWINRACSQINEALTWINRAPFQTNEACFQINGACFQTNEALFQIDDHRSRPSDPSGARNARSRRCLDPLGRFDGPPGLRSVGLEQ